MGVKNYEIAQRLKAIRELSDVTAAELSAKLGMTEDEYNLLESGDVDIAVAGGEAVPECDGPQLAVFLPADGLHVIPGREADHLSRPTDQPVVVAVNEPVQITALMFRFQYQA